MTKKVLAYDDQTGQCELASVAPNTGIVSTNGSITFTSQTLPDGQTIYDISDVSSSVQPLINSAQGNAIAIHSGSDDSADGDAPPVTIYETVTEVSIGNTPGFQFQNEAGQTFTFTLCEMMDNVPDGGLIIGI